MIDTKVKSIYKKKYIFVYKTVNAVNGKNYIGVHSTDNINDGYIGCGVYSDAHAKGCKKYGLKSAFIDAVVKHGYENFTREILCFFDTQEEAYATEAHLVDLDRISLSSSYNIALGGRGGGSHTREVTDEQIAEMRRMYMDGYTMGECAGKFGFTTSVCFKNTRDLDTTNRVHRKRRMNAQKVAEEYKDYVIKLYKGGMTKTEINKRIPFDLYSNDVIKESGAKQYKYVLLVDGEEDFKFTTAKEASEKLGIKLHNSGIAMCAKGAISSYKNHMFIHYDDYKKGIRSNGVNKPKAKHHGVKLQRGNEVLVIDDSLIKFSKKHDMHPELLSRLLRGEIHTHRGFKAI